MSQPQRATLDAFMPGTDLSEVVYGPIQRVDIVRYAGASGDFNPIHIDEGYARSTGAPTVFAMGMLPAGYLAHAMSDWFGGPQHLKRFKVRFTTRVWPGDEIVCTGRVDSMEGSTINVSMQAVRRGAGPGSISLAQEEIALIGEADIQLPE